jgi:hypothetical protein
MIFKPMNRELREKLIKDAPDPLGEEHKKDMAFFNSLSCPSCSEGVVPILNKHFPFRYGKLTPNMIARCNSCNCEFDPYTGLISQPPDKVHTV